MYIARYNRLKTPVSLYNKEMDAQWIYLHVRNMHNYVAGEHVAGIAGYQFLSKKL
jgi:hypothetical protein